MLSIDRIDHLVLTVRDVSVTCAFYGRVLGMKTVTFGNGRTALTFGNQKINLHPVEAPIAPHAQRPAPGSADLCLITHNSMDQVVKHLMDCGVPIVEGPVRRTGATGAISSVYLRDPDGNLLEVSLYQT